MSWNDDLDTLLAKLSSSEQEVILRALKEVEEQTRHDREIEFFLKRRWLLTYAKVVAQVCFWFFLVCVLVLVILLSV